MASKTVTRSILASAWKSILGDLGAHSGSKGKSKRPPLKKKMARRKVLFFAIRLSLARTICPWVSEDAGKVEGAMGRGTRREKPLLLFPFPIVSRAFLTNNRRVDWKKSRRFPTPLLAFPKKWHLRNECRNSILMIRHYPDLGSASWLAENLLRPVRSTSPQIWVVSMDFVCSFIPWGNQCSVGVANNRPFSQARLLVVQSCEQVTYKTEAKHHLTWCPGLNRIYLDHFRVSSSFQFVFSHHGNFVSHVCI